MLLITDALAAHSLATTTAAQLDTVADTAQDSWTSFAIATCKSSKRIQIDPLQTSAFPKFDIIRNFLNFK